MEEEEVLAALQELKARISLLAEHRQRVEQVLEGISGKNLEIESAANELREAIDGIVIPGGTGTGAASPEADANLAQLSDAASTLREALETVEQRVTQTTATLQSIEVAEEAWLDRRRSAIEGLMNTVESGVSVVQEDYDQMVEAVENLSATWEEQSASVVARVDALADDVNEKLYEPMREIREDFTDTLNEMVEGVAEDIVPASITSTAEQAVGDLKQTLDDLAKSLGDSLEEFVRDTFASREAGDGGRSSLQPALDQLESVIDPVMNELDRIRGLAGSVGIHV